MIPAIKSEFRKLISLRSSYLIPLFAFGFLAFIATYVQGYKNGQANTQGTGAPYLLSYTLATHTSLLALFAAVVALLVVAHEYRYNLIMYTLTTVSRRSTVLVAKFISVLTYTFCFMLIGAAVGLGGVLLGLHIAGVALPPQDFSALDYFAKAIVYGEAWAFAGLLLATLMRNQVGALVTLLVGPNTVEPLLGLLLKDNTKFLPFTALSNLLVSERGPQALERGATHVISWTPWQGALVFGVYLVIGWIVAWVLFVRRDAN